ncbi:hypothetical protein JCM17846_05210 [Iodidimonas nitroreducens]|uniref:Uncharacterized protein n=1 Tax=Iodidimonas nitroreducens TaxID=1236968 RepID=A0A5A7N6Z5_9PROT|nr:hypothetical protein JCM17846_05210 [Iodidimonas nitroreducens]
MGSSQGDLARFVVSCFFWRAAPPIACVSPMIRLACIAPIWLLIRLSMLLELALIKAGRVAHSPGKG